MSSIRMPNALLPLDCLMTAACSLLYISFADSFGLMICFISSDRAPSITPAATLFAVFHSFSCRLGCSRRRLGRACGIGVRRCCRSGSLLYGARVHGLRIKCDGGILSSNGTVDVVVPQVPVVVAQLDGLVDL